jgi:hypothetical protein
VIGDAELAQCVVLRQGQLEEQIARLLPAGAAVPGINSGARGSGDDRH